MGISKNISEYDGSKAESVGANEDGSTILSFVDFKESLGGTAGEYSDEQIEHLRITLDKIADATFDKWLQQRNAGVLVPCFS